MAARLDYTKVSPAGVKALGSVYGYVMQSGLDETLVELVYLRVSQINGCAYCLDMHTRDLLKRGSPPKGWRSSRSCMRRVPCLTSASRQRSPGPKP
jgi:AhpD family alkylhydroperoxidase